MELQADCFAGLCGRSAFIDQLLERGDLEEGIGAAGAIGDDRIQDARLVGKRVDWFTTWIRLRVGRGM